MTAINFRRLVRGVAVLDLFSSAALATPWTFGLMLWLLGRCGPLPAFEPLHLLFVYLLGALCVAWGVVRIAKPEPWLGLADAVARLVFAAWMAYFLLARGINPLVWLFAGLELAPAAAVLAAYFRRSRA